MGEVEREDEYNPIQEYPEQGIQDKLREWYIARGMKAAEALEKRGVDTRDEREFADKATRQENLVREEKRNVREFDQLKAEVERLASNNGVKFDPKTGEVSFDGERNFGTQQASVQEISEVSEKLSKVSGEYSAIANNLYGEDMSDPHFDPEKSRNPGIVAEVNQKKQALMKRDASVKKLLDAKVRLEVAKDKMDMHGARHAAEKYRLMMILEQLKLQLVRRIASGAKEDDLTVQSLKKQIGGVSNQIAALEAEFRNSHSAYTTEFNEARNGLEDASKIVSYDNDELEGVKAKNSLSYSKDGILNGSVSEVRHNDRDVEEKEIFDERGVMIFDIADVLEREKSIQIGGVVVTCVTEFGPGPNVEDSFYIGELEQLEVNTSEARTVVEEEPSMEEEIDNENVGNATTISLFQRELTDAFYSVAGKMIRDQEQAQKLDAALKGPFRDALSTFGRGADVQRAVIDLAIEVAKELAKETEIVDPNDPNYKRENVT